MRMELGLSQHQTIKQIQTLSPQMYMSMEILCLNSLDLEERIETELEANEALERVEPAVQDGVSPEAPALEAPSTEGSFEGKIEGWDSYSREEQGEFRARSSFEGERDEKLDALSNTEGRPVSLQEHLEEQVHLLDAAELRKVAGELSPQEERAVLDACVDIIYNIDHRGYLLYPIEEIQASLEHRPPLEVLQKALLVVQSLDPPGIGGKDLKECLLLQLRRDRQKYPVEEKIIEEHLHELGHNRLPKIAKALGISIEDVKVAAETIASLNPLPGKLFGGEAAPFIRPDVIVEEVEGQYEVRIAAEWQPRLQVTPRYLDLYRNNQGDTELKKYLKKKLDSAEWLIAAIRQRQTTLRKIAEVVVEIQSGYLEHGISQLKPLKMLDVAERVGVHVSTISRAISGKHIQTPRGILPLKFFFSGGATKDDGTVEVRGSVIHRIKELISLEDKQGPLSDIDIVKELAKSNIRISRRTVTKYREAEGIPSSRERRAY